MLDLPLLENSSAYKEKETKFSHSLQRRYFEKYGFKNYSSKDDIILLEIIISQTRIMKFQLSGEVGGIGIIKENNTLMSVFGQGILV